MEERNSTIGHWELDRCAIIRDIVLILLGRLRRHGTGLQRCLRLALVRSVGIEYLPNGGLAMLAGGSCSSGLVIAGVRLTA